MFLEFEHLCNYSILTEPELNENNVFVDSIATEIEIHIGTNFSVQYITKPAIIDVIYSRQMQRTCTGCSLPSSWL